MPNKRLRYLDVSAEDSVYKVQTGEIGDINVINGTAMVSEVEQISSGSISIYCKGKEAVTVFIDESQYIDSFSYDKAHGSEEDVADTIHYEKDGFLEQLDNLLYAYDTKNKDLFLESYSIVEDYDDWQSLFEEFLNEYLPPAHNVEIRVKDCYFPTIKELNSAFNSSR